MKKVIYIAITVVSFMLPGLSRGQAILVNDPSFEDPEVGSLLGGFKTYVYNSTTPVYLNGPSGWYVSAGTNGSGSVTLVDQGLIGALIAPITGASSSQYLALNGLAINLLQLTPGALGGVSQDITTVVGQTYRVDYKAGALSLGVATTNTAQLLAGVNGVTVTSPDGGALLNLGIGTFTDHSFTFTAASTTSTLNFTEPSALLANVGGVAIDNVSVTAVPEPAESAAILLVCAMVIIGVRRFIGTWKTVSHFPLT